MLDYEQVERLRRDHKAWQLLRVHHAPLVISFLNRVFVVPNRRTIPEEELVSALEDELFSLREIAGRDADRDAGENARLFGHSADYYLNMWVNRGWLRKFYPLDKDEPHFDMTPATEKAIAWVASLEDRSFVGTESRLLTLFSLLQQMHEGSRADPAERLKELEKKREDVEHEIELVKEGRIRVLDDTALRDRFQQFQATARELLADFREVEYNFRVLDRNVRERIAGGGKNRGELLEEVVGESNVIANSDQGRSFDAFCLFLMSRTRIEEFSSLLDEMLEHPAIAAMQPDERIRRVHSDLLEAGWQIKTTMARTDEQLRRLLDERALHENRRVTQILEKISAKALEIRDHFPKGAFTEIEDGRADIELPWERPLYRPSRRIRIEKVDWEKGEETADAETLFARREVNTTDLKKIILTELAKESPLTLGQIVARHPLTLGLAELLGYLQVARELPHTTVDESREEKIPWEVHRYEADPNDPFAPDGPDEANEPINSIDSTGSTGSGAPADPNVQSSSGGAEELVRVATLPCIVFARRPNDRLPDPPSDRLPDRPSSWPPSLHPEP